MWEGRELRREGGGAAKPPTWKGFDDQLKNSGFNVKGAIMFNLFERLQKFKN